MKPVLMLAVCLSMAFSSRSATNITTPTVAGHWTLSGSPYNIFNNITIPLGSVLTIDPGVEVVFQGYYSMTAVGILLSAGSAGLPIRYYVADTTGKHNTTNVQGGWAGMSLNYATGSTFEYCDVADMKAVYDTGYGFNGYTNMRIANCKFHDNILTVNLGASSFTIQGLIGLHAYIDMDSCEIYNNISNYNTIRYFNASSSIPLKIQNCNIHHNISYGTPGLGASVSIDGPITFTNNLVHHEVCSDGTFVSRTDPPLKAFISKNRFYNNTNRENAAINCNGGSPVAENNFVCNNVDDSAWCGLTSGGGGIHIYSNGPNDTSKMIIRNNIIANNLSATPGGAIYIYNCNAVVTNNQIVNNQCDTRGAAIAANLGSGHQYIITIKNNIIYGNFDPFTPGPSDLYISATSKCKLEYSHNWAERTLSANSYFPIADSVVCTDTTGNIVGSNPGLVLPTVSHSFSESALSSDFGLLTTSPCIDKGSANAYSGTFDYANSLRTIGSCIDIGAYEYGSTSSSTPVLINKQSTINIHPNPASNLTYITTPSPAGSLLLLDMSGRSIAEKTVNSLTTSFDLQHVPPGTYIIQWNANGQTAGLQKIVVE